MKIQYILLFLTTIYLNIFSSEESNKKQGTVSVYNNSISTISTSLNRIILSYNNLYSSIYNNKLNIEVEITLDQNVATQFLNMWKELYHPIYDIKFHNFLSTEIAKQPKLAKNFLNSNRSISIKYLYQTNKESILLYVPIYIFANADGSFKQDGSITIKTTYGEQWELKLDETFSNNKLQEMLTEYKSNISYCNIQ